MSTTKRTNIYARKGDVYLGHLLKRVRLLVETDMFDKNGDNVAKSKLPYSAGAGWRGTESGKAGLEGTLMLDWWRKSICGALALYL